jgi:SAM-dependent methyltransferase
MCRNSNPPAPARPGVVYSDATGSTTDLSEATQDFSDVTTLTEFGDDDSTYGDEVASSTTSLSTAEYLFEKRNGRTYHTFGRDREYVLPNDEPEKDRLDMQYWAIHEIFGEKHYFAPIGDNPQEIIDIGTGTGIWAIDMGDKFPSAIVTGTDLSPIQPTWVPPNVTFELHDCVQYPWDFRKLFDFVHTQLINGFAVRDWTEFYTEAYQNLKPGGWVESHEFDLWLHTEGNAAPEPVTIRAWLDQWDKGAGGGFRCSGDQLADSMRKAGFVDVGIKEFKLPVGPWMKGQENSGILSITAMTEHIVEKLGMTEDQMKQHTDPVVREWRNRRLHSYWKL